MENTNKKKVSPWRYFEQNKDFGICQIQECRKRIKSVGGSTSGLHSHLKSIHKINLLKKDSDNCETASLVNKSDTAVCGKITTYFKKTVDESLPAVISRMIARDGLPFVKICTSYDIRSLLKSKGYINIPKSPNTVRNIVLDFAKTIRKQVTEEMLTLKGNASRFSITLDEWTSTRNRRYVNINVHGNNQFWNLGLARAHGTMTAEDCRDILESKLAKFGLEYEDLVGATTDGASVMKKFGNLLHIIHQLCFAHGIQLAVIKVLYRKAESPPAAIMEEEEDYDITTDSIGEDEDDDDYEDEETGGIQVINNESCVNNLMPPNLSTLISKIRKVVKMFRKSPTKNDAVLQKHVTEKFGKCKSLILDSKTRWNSLLDMFERFYELRDCIRKSLIDLKVDFNFTLNELDLLYNLISALQPVKIAVETLCCEDANLFSADVTLKFMLDEISKQDSSLCTLCSELKDELIMRIRERRTNYSDVLQFLHNPDDTQNEDEYNIFNTTSKTAITKLIIEIAERLNINETNTNFRDKNSDEETAEADVIHEPEVPSRLPTMKERLHLMILEKSDAKIETRIRNDEKDVGKIVRKQMKTFADEKVRGKYLNLVYKYLMTIRPTSVASERAFSSAGLICTKIRSRLSDESLNELCFLRAYFNTQNELLKCY